MFDKIFGVISTLVISISSLIGIPQTDLISQPNTTPFVEESYAPEVLAVEIEVSPEPTPVMTARPTFKPTPMPTVVPTPTPKPLPNCNDYKRPANKEPRLPSESEREKAPKYQQRLKDFEIMRENGECI